MEDGQNSNPLLRLVAGNEPIDLELLANILEPYVQLHTEPPHPEYTWDGEHLNNKKKILAYLLARKALLELHLIETDKVSPSTIEADTKIPGGSIRPVLKDLREKKLVRENDGYFVPNNAIKQVQKLFEGADE